MKIINVNAISEYRLQVTYDDGISGIVNLIRYILQAIPSRGVMNWK